MEGLGESASVADLEAMNVNVKDTFVNLHIENPIDDQEMTLNEIITIDITNVFVDPSGNPITVIVEENSNPSVLSASISGTTLTLQTNSTSGKGVIKLKASQGANIAYDNFEVMVNLTSSIVFKENFENSGSIPEGWTQEIITGTTNWTFISGGSNGTPSLPHSGNYNACLSNNSSDPHETKLITPEISLSSYLMATLEFYNTQALWSPDQDELHIYYRKSSSDSWVLLKNFTEGIANWTKQSIELPLESFTNTFQIAFDGIAKYGYGVCLDDVSIVGYEPGSGIENPSILKDFSLAQNYPNPFNPTTTIEFHNDISGKMNLVVYNVNGEVIKTLINGNISKGSHSIRFDASSLNSGVYYYKLQSQNNSITKKMILVK